MIVGRRSRTRQCQKFIVRKTKTNRRSTKLIVRRRRRKTKGADKEIVSYCRGAESVFSKLLKLDILDLLILNLFIYVYDCTAQIAQIEKTIRTGKLIVFDNKGCCKVKAEDNVTKLILVAGKPLNEPVVRAGPFVMNTRREIVQAFTDYDNGGLDKA